MGLGLPFEHPLVITVVVALVVTTVQLVQRDKLDLRNFLDQFNSFPFYIVLAIFSTCSVLARGLNSAVVTWLVGYCFHHSHSRNKLVSLPEIHRDPEFGITTATPSTPDLRQLPFRRDV